MNQRDNNSPPRRERDWPDRDRERQHATGSSEEPVERYGQREPYNTSGPGYDEARRPDEFGRNRWGGPTDYGYRGESRYSESQYGEHRQARDALRSAPRSRYGSGDFGFEHGQRGEPQFGEGPFGDSSESPRFFGSGNYGEGGAHFTGGYEPRGTQSPRYVEIGTGDYGHGYDRPQRQERPGFFQRTFKQGPKGYQRSDERLREDISERLMQAGDIDSSEVTVTVTAGKVTLEGTVPDRYMKHYIEDIVDVCPGVQDIDNRVRVDANSGRSTNRL